MSPLQFNYKAAIAIVAIGVVALYCIYLCMADSKGTWNMKQTKEIPQSILDMRDSVKIEERDIELRSGARTFKVHLREVNPNKKELLNVLFLHGAGSSSKVWVEIKSLHLIGAMGLRGMAIDHPGPDSDIDKADFLDSLIKQEKLGKPVIVSPSMSGSYSLPYLIGSAPELCHERASGFIPLAPVWTTKYSDSAYSVCSIPTLVVYGTEDRTLGTLSSRHLRNMKNAELSPMKNTGHVCYVDNPKQWNRMLYKFLVNPKLLKNQGF